MSKLYSSREIIVILEKYGFECVAQKGSHMKFTNAALKAVVIVPANRKEIPVGTFHSIVRQSKLTKEDFEF